MFPSQLINVVSYTELFGFYNGYTGKRFLQRIGNGLYLVYCDEDWYIHGDKKWRYIYGNTNYFKFKYKIILITSSTIKKLGRVRWYLKGGTLRTTPLSQVEGCGFQSKRKEGGRTVGPVPVHWTLVGWSLESILILRPHSVCFYSLVRPSSPLLSSV